MIWVLFIMLIKVKHIQPTQLQYITEHVPIYIACIVHNGNVFGLTLGVVFYIILNQIKLLFTPTVELYLIQYGEMSETEPYGGQSAHTHPSNTEDDQADCEEEDLHVGR